MRKLSELLKFLKVDVPAGCTDESDQEIEFLEGDSRKIRKGDVFVALSGLHADGRNFIKKAQDQGAVAYLYKEPPTAAQLEGVTIPGYPLQHRRMSTLATWYYKDPSRRVKVIGVTGTNGKSTVTWLIAQMLTALSFKCAVIGTLGTGFLPNLKKSANTTPDALSLQRLLYELAEQGAQYAAMEVSSIGLCEGRVDGCMFKAAAFTNLTRDHLDYHKTMEDYYQAKKKLFLTLGENGYMCANFRDEYGRRIISEINSLNMYAYQASDNEDEIPIFNRVLAVKKKFCPDGVDLKMIAGTDDSGECHLPLLGSFNVENFTCAFTVLTMLGLDFDSILQVVPVLKPVTGRMECFKKEGKPSVIVDYAHTPDGVEQVLRAAREHHPHGRIFIVLGCGGDRDKGKRPIMAIKASVYADTAVFTSDNPRSEDPISILEDMRYGVSEASNCEFIVDRLEAIKWAFEHAGPEDCVVIAGKGHEDYQIFKDKTVHFSDREIASELVGGGASK